MIRVWTTTHVSCESASKTPRWVNVDDLKALAGSLEAAVEKLQRITPGNCSHVCANVNTVLGHHARVLKEITG